MVGSVLLEKRNLNQRSHTRTKMSSRNNQRLFPLRIQSFQSCSTADGAYNIKGKSVLNFIYKKVYMKCRQRLKSWKKSLMDEMENGREHLKMDCLASSSSPLKPINAYILKTLEENHKVVHRLRDTVHMIQERRRSSPTTRLYFADVTNYDDLNGQVSNLDDLTNWTDHLVQYIQLKQYPSIGQLKDQSNSLMHYLMNISKIVDFPEEMALQLLKHDLQFTCNISSVDYLKIFSSECFVLDSLPSDNCHFLPKCLSSYGDNGGDEGDDDNDGVRTLIMMLQSYVNVKMWVVDALLCQKSFEHRKFMLVFILRACQLSFEIGSLNSAVALIAGLRSKALQPFWLSLGDRSLSRLEPFVTFLYHINLNACFHLICSSSHMIPFVGGVLWDVWQRLFAGVGDYSIDRYLTVFVLKSGKLKFVADYKVVNS
ncbi:hypothetical protein HELRODRAFT_188670, partial [Helobdella robusta]|uniref:Ras-GEF domain-containing protein n=1 Tax=Helobdella robusta TaxID=6412 RepID=T1FQ83_HELRO